MRFGFPVLNLIFWALLPAAQAFEETAAVPERVSAVSAEARIRVLPEQFAAVAMPVWEDSRPVVPQGTDELLGAVRSGQLDRVKAVLNSGALPNAADERGERPLALAVAGEYAEIVRLLLQRGASPDLKGALGLTPLSMAAAAGNSGIVRILLSAGAEANARSNNRASALHEAIRFDHPETVRALLRAQPDPENFDREGLHPLALAAARGRLACLSALLDSGIPPDLADRNKLTALYWARRYNQELAESLLVEHGAGREAWPIVDE